MTNPLRSRRALKALHWTSAVALVILISGPRAAVEENDAARAVLMIFLGVSALWLLAYAMGGGWGRPGPKLGAVGRATFTWGHRLLYAGMAVTLATGAARLMPQAGAWAEAIGPYHSRALFTLGAIAAVHSIFHLWRHTALYDNALRAIVPRAMHHLL
jgi:cytochrome b561